MYLSRVEINSLNRQRLRDLSHLGAYHNWVEQSFPSEVTKDRSRKLWRLDKLQGKDYLLIMSEEKPDINKLEHYGVSGTGEVKEYNDFLDSLSAHKNYRFRITINPIVARSSGKLSGKRGRVFPLVREEEQLKYLLDRSESNGFSVLEEDCYVKNSNVAKLRKSGNNSIKILKVTIEGILTITDKEKFKNMMVMGLGKKKAYGCGLMTVIPV
ncbi:MAG: type I-E CRISPR-associated protein Cas6/Cse3/CasE [Gallicola sp.]|nr:type I-E CRISPR-associated protein Cas6/Cse3/CasE [Gallicola sp.]